MNREKRILINNALALITMDDRLREYRPGAILLEGNRILKIGSRISAKADLIIDAQGKIILPGFINTHHHLFQVLTRNVPKVQNAGLFDWLTNLYEIWRELTPPAVYLSALTGLGELLLTGCTTSSDHLYLFPKKSKANLIDEEIRAAKDIGIRFHATRGSMSCGKSHGGLPPDDIVQDDKTILKDSQRLIEKYHDPAEYSMLRIALAPCSPFSVTTELLRDTAQLARQYNVRLHTHIAETIDEEKYCLDKYGLRPMGYMEKIGFLGDDVWFAHGIHLSAAEIQLLAQTKTGIAHCPVSNLRLGSGICPVPQLMQSGVPVGLAVDGSASNDSSDMLSEIRQCLLIHRISSGVNAMSARKTLRLATRGGAQLLGRNDIGSLEIGKSADLVLFDLNQLGYAGAWHDPVAALIFAGFNHRADLVIVNGIIRVKDGKLVGIKELDLIRKTNRLADKMLKNAIKNSGINFLESTDE